MIHSAATCYIDLAAIEYNYRQLRALAPIFPVLKSDAYGHGLYECAQVLDSNECQTFCVGYVKEAVYLRRKGFRQEINPLFGCLNIQEALDCIEYQITPLLHSPESIIVFERYCEALHEKVEAVLKVDCGMNRLGISIDDLPNIMLQLAHNKYIKVKYLFAHISQSKKPARDKQITRVKKAHAELLKQIPDIQLSYGASAALLTSPGKHIYRPGLALYGVKPQGCADKGPALKAAMKYFAPIIGKRMARAGETISYGDGYVSPRDTCLYVCGLGYANGLRIAGSGKLKLVVNEELLPQVGPICMNMMMLDAGPDALKDIMKDVSADELPDAAGNEADIDIDDGLESHAPDAAILIDDDLPIEAAARACGASVYEMLCALGNQTERVYMR